MKIEVQRPGLLTATLWDQLGPQLEDRLVPCRVRMVGQLWDRVGYMVWDRMRDRLLAVRIQQPGESHARE